MFRRCQRYRYHVSVVSGYVTHNFREYRIFAKLEIFSKPFQPVPSEPRLSFLTKNGIENLVSKSFYSQENSFCHDLCALGQKEEGGEGGWEGRCQGSEGAEES